MPDYMAKRVSDSVNKKPESPEDKLQKALDEVARDIALIEPNPKDWESGYAVITWSTSLLLPLHLNPHLLTIGA